MSKETYFENYTSLEDALTTAIRMSDKEPKEVAILLWPNTPSHTAYQRLIDALSPTKSQKLSLYEIKNIMFICNRFDPLFWLVDECLFDRPERKVVEQEAQHVKELVADSFAKITKQYQQLMRMMDRQEEMALATTKVKKT